MNVYLVVEGNGEKEVYKRWIERNFQSLSIVNNIEEVTNNNVLIVSGGGYPNYFNVIKNAIEDICNSTKFDRLVVAIDSEDIEYRRKKVEVGQKINENIPQNHTKQFDYRIIVQHFCLETWALGNRSIFRRNPESAELRNFISFYNVLNSDPEGLPALNEEMNRAQFALIYLKRIIQEHSPRLGYDKSSPRVLYENNTYFEEIRVRHLDTGHIASFGDFLTAFS